MDLVKLVVLIVFCHMVGDCVLQSDFIATTKGSNYYHLFVHCVLYCLPFYVVFGLTWELGVILVSHIIIDSAKAKFKAIDYWQDQTLHYLAGMIYLF